MPDIIRLTGVLARCRIGVPAAERRRAQKIIFDVALETDVRKAARTDGLEHSIDYHALEKRLRRKAETGKFRLLERLAEVLADTALASARRVRAVTVIVRKKPAAMPKTREVSVEIRRQQRKR